MPLAEQERGDLDKAIKDLNLSNDEMGKFAKAFKDPEFIKMFEEYAKEVSDPKVKAETDAYLRQVEMEGRIEEVYGKGVQLVVPEESFVIKTKDKKTGQKMFINVCTSDKVEKARTEVGVGADGKKGTHFELPLSLGPMKKGTDKTGAPCSVIDFVVHPDTVGMARSKPAILGLLADTAMEKVEQVHAGLKLDRQHTRPNLKYKASEGCDKPHVLAIRATGSEAETVAGKIRPVDSKSASPMPPPASLANGAAAAAKAAPGVAPAGAAASASGPAGAAGASKPGAAARSDFKFGGAKPAPQPAAPTDPSQAGFVHPGGEVTPQWSVVHRGEVDLADTWGDAGRNIALSTTCPKELVVKVQLPGVTSAAAVDLDVSRAKLVITVPQKYILEAALPYSVDDSRGKAKFDKAKQTLEVTLPVIPPPPPTTSMPLRQPLVQPTEAASEQPAAEHPQAEQAPAAASGTQDSGSAGPAAGERDSREPVSGSVPGTEAPAPAGVPAANSSTTTSSSQEAELTENQRRWAELHRQEQERKETEQAQGQAEHQDASAGAGASHSGDGSNEAGPQEGTKGTSAAPAPAAAVPVAAAAPPPAVPAVQLKPRLNKALAEDLD